MTDPSPPIAPQPAPPRVAARAAPPRRQRALTAAVALAAVVSLGYLALRPAPPGASGVRPVDPVTVPAVPIEGATGFVERRTHVGRVEAARVSRIGSELGGAVLEMLVDEGDRVTPGQPLARFDTARLRARRAELDAERLRQEAILAELRAGPRREDIDAQKAQCARLDAAAALARATAARVRAARDHDAVSAQEWDAARLQAEQAEAAAAAAKADLDELNAGSRAERLAAQEAAVEALLAAIAAVDVDLGKTLVRAPFAGRVSDRLVDEGEVLAPGAPLLELREEAPASSDGTSAAGGLEVRVGVLPRLAATLREGQSLPIRYRGHRASAEVVAVRSDRSVRTRTVSVLLRALVTEAGGATAAAPRLRDGELVEVEFEHRVETAGFWLPHAALTEGARGLWRCFVLEPDPTGGTFRVVGRTVEVVHFDEERAYVRGALEDSDLVVSGGTHRLVPGISARIAAESAR